jgi:hypothetical protein
VHEIAVMMLNPDGYFTEPSQSLTLDRVPFGPFTAARAGGDRACLQGGSTNACFTIDIVAMNLAEIRQLQGLPDGRVLFVEGDADVRMLELEGNRIDPAYTPEADPDTEVRVTGLALAPDFTRTRHVFLALVRKDGGGTTTTDIVRARELGGRLGEVLTVVSQLPTAEGTEPALAVAPDGRLYVAMGEARMPGSRAAPYDGRVVRFESDGRSAVRPGWPVFARGTSSPAAIETDAAHRVWLAERNDRAASPLSVIAPTSSDFSLEATARPVALTNWPDDANGVRALSVGRNRDAGATLYVAPGGLAALLVAYDRPVSSAVTVAQLPLPGLHPTAVTALASGVILVGGSNPAAIGPARATLLRLRETR